MIETSASINVEEVDKALRDMAERGRRLAPAFRKIRPALRRDQRDHARAQQGPDSSWAPRAAATEHARRRKNRSLRVSKAMRQVMLKPITRRRATPAKVLGRLPLATIYTVSPLFARATSRSLYPGGANQHGGRVGRRRRVRLPARPFLWLSDALLDASKRIIAEHIVAGWPGAQRPSP